MSPGGRLTGRSPRLRRAWRVLAGCIAVAAALCLVGCPTNGSEFEPPPPDPPEEPYASIGVYVNETWVDDFDTIAIDSVFPGTGRTAVLSIWNYGNGPLCLTGTPAVIVSGPGAGFVSVEEPLADCLAAGATLDLAVGFDPAATGAVQPSFAIESNDHLRSLVVFTLDATPAPAPARPIATGQTTSFVTGDDGDLQRGEPWPDPRFTANPDGTTTDNLTGLMWRSDPGDTRMAWTTAVTVPYNSTFADYDDWRLPNVNEMMTLVDANAATPASALNAHDEFTGVYSDDYLTSTRIYESPTAWSWVVQLDNGVLSRVNITAIATDYGWMVRTAGTGATGVARTGKTGMSTAGDDGHLQAGVEWPSPRFVPDAEGTVIDRLTGLMWVATPSGTTMTWSEAFAFVATLANGGHTDWRVPNRNELRSLVNYNYTNNATHLGWSFEPPIPSGEYWSSTARMTAGTQSWGVTIDSGHSFYIDTDTPCYVWAVRGGES